MVLAKFAPPVGVQEYDFSWSVSNDQFRFKVNGDEWLCSQVAGTVWCRYANSVNHRMDLVCELAIDSQKVATVWAPDGDTLTKLRAEPAILNFAREDLDTVRINESGLRPLAEFPQGRDTHWRLCSLNWENAWRLRDERSDADGGELFIVNGYRGLMKFSQLDGGSHVFADGPATVDAHGIVHFG